MSESAHVTSVDAMVEFGSHLRRFEEDMLNTLMLADQQVVRVLEWFEHDGPAQWKRRIRECFNEVAETRARLESCRMRTVAGHRPACDQEKKDHEQARRKLQRAQEQAEGVQRWARRLHEESQEYRGRTGSLRRYMESDFQKSVALLERYVAALESYTTGSVGEPPVLPHAAGESSADKPQKSDD